MLVHQLFWFIHVDQASDDSGYLLALDASRRQYSLSNPSSSSSIVFLVLESVDRIKSVAAHALPCRQLVQRHGLVVVPLAVVLMHGQASLAVVLMHGQG